MKNIYRSIGLSLFISISCAVTAQQNLSSTELNVNNVHALFHPVGHHFWDLIGGAKYEVPAGSGCNSIFTSTLWIGGLDCNGQLHIAAEQYRQDGADYFTGPLTIDGLAEIESDVVEQWNRMWPIWRGEIEGFLECVNNPECPDYIIPDHILNWPGNGDVVAGQSQNLAHYVDVNSDNIYNPEDGDYPDFPGDYALFFVFNDAAEVHTETGGEKIRVEVHGLAYAFSCYPNEAFNNTVFLSYDIINRSTITYYDFYVGSFTDFDIGNGYDDYIGCDVVRGCYYGYNGDDNDEDYQGAIGYGEYPPAQATVFLAGPMADADGMDNSTSYDTVDNVPVLNCARGDIFNGNINGLNYEDGIVDNERYGMTRFVYWNTSGGNSATLSPNSAIEYYNYLRGRWRDYSPICYGGTGHTSGGADPNTYTAFVFPGSPTSDPCGWGQGGVIQTDWSEETEANTPSDRKGLGVSGPFTFLPNETLELDLAFVYGRSADPEVSSVEIMLQYVDEIRNGYLTNTTPCGTEFQPTGIGKRNSSQSFEVGIFPNPASNELTLEISSNKNSLVSIKIMDVNGRVYLTNEISANAGNSKSSIDISSLSAGVYFVAVDNGDFVTNKKLIVLK